MASIDDLNKTVADLRDVIASNTVAKTGALDKSTIDLDSMTAVPEPAI